MTTTTPYVITGITTGVYPRLEIQDLQKNKPEQFTLFILGWNKIREPNYQPVAAQHVQLGGIHGLPYARWPGDPAASTKPVGDDDWEGYCNHGSVLFPTWHRPCVMAVEQAIGEAAKSIAAQFASQYPAEAQKWTQAATELRFPFWDWTLPSTGTVGLPTVLKADTPLTLVMPGGKTSQTENILAFYRFNGARPQGFADGVQEGNPLVPGRQIAYFESWDRTYRWPASQPGQPKEDYAAIDNILKGKSSQSRGSYKNLVNQVAHLFSFPSQVSDQNLSPRIWDEFSNTTFQSGEEWPSPYNAGSLESPHNSVHLVIGGIGHMGDNDYAGFDPIFYLHHCNVDRILALWEYVYPNYWMGEGYVDANGQLQKFTQPEGTWAERDDAAIDENTTHEPYRKTSANYWIASDTRSLEPSATVKKYYTYPAVEGVAVEQPATPAQRAQYLAALQRHFGLNPLAARDDAPKLNAPMFSSTAPEALPKGHEAIDNYRHFCVGVSLLEHAFGASYALEVLYDGKESLGSVAVLTRGNPHAKCAGCQGRRRAKNRVRGVVSIPTRVVAEIVQKEHLNEADVSEDALVNALKKHISAKVVMPDGTPVATASHGATGGGAPLGEDVKPVLTFASSNASLPEAEGKKGAFRYYDWKHHGGLLGDAWTTA